MDMSAVSLNVSITALIHTLYQISFLLNDMPKKSGWISNIFQCPKRTAATSERPLVWVASINIIQRLLYSHGPSDSFWSTAHANHRLIHLDGYFFVLIPCPYQEWLSISTYLSWCLWLFLLWIHSWGNVRDDPVADPLETYTEVFTSVESSQCPPAPGLFNLDH